MDYIKQYKKHPKYVEQRDQTSRAIQSTRAKINPLPVYARMQIHLTRKVAKVAGKSVPVKT